MGDPHADLVVVKHLSDPASAKVVAQLLLLENIPALVNGAELLDEFAMSQMLMGNVACDVQVPREYEERARKVLAAAKDTGERLAESDVWKDKDQDKNKDRGNEDT